MKKVFLFILLILSNVGFGQQIPLPLNNPNLLKVSVIKDGIHRLTKADFDAAGIATGSIDPRTIRVINKGQEKAIYFHGQENGTFDPNDYLDFFAERNYGGPTNFYNNILSFAYQKYEYFNLYSDTNVYWITWGGVNGLRFNQNHLHSTINYEKKYFYKELHLESDLFYTLGEQLNGSDMRRFLNDMLRGEGWFWRTLQFNNILDVFTNIRMVYTGEVLPVRVNLNAYPENSNPSILNEHRVALNVNNVAIDTFYSNNMNMMDTNVYLNNTQLVNNGSNFFRFRYRPPTTFTSGRMNIDYFKIFYPKRMALDSNQLTFTSENTDSTSRIYRISGYALSGELNIYDVKNNYRIDNYNINGDTLIYIGKGNGKFEIINKPVTQKPLRITQRTLPDLVNSSNGADYLIIYNKLFAVQAEQLRVHRESTDGFRSVKVEIEDVYDVFNYGVENPVAVRNFMEHVYNNWQLPRVKYLCLFGRGSLDPKKNSTASVYYKNFVPVWGNPTADGYFVNFTPGTFTYIQKISVGRLPAYTPEEAQILVDKIIYDEQRPLEKWDKLYAMITGGFSNADQNSFSATSNIIINNYIAAPPLSSEAIRIYRKDSVGYSAFNYSDSIINVLNRGVGVVNYYGRAATGHWDNGIEDPSVIHNNGKPFTVFSFTCYTNRNAEANEKSFGEKFVLLPDNRGAVSFIGSTGWAFDGSGAVVNSNFFKTISNDTTRIIGDALKQIGYYLINDTASFSFSHMLNSFNLIGDPASKLKQPKSPEFTISQDAYQLSDEYPSLQEGFYVSLFPLNLGNYADSCNFRYTLYRNGVTYDEFDTVIHRIGFKLNLTRWMVLDSMGTYSLKVEIDPDNWFPNDDPSDNVIELDIPLRNISYTPLKPLDNEIQKSLNVDFVGINPTVNPSKKVKVILQIDTTSMFNSPVKQIYFQEGVDASTTKFSSALPVADSTVIYYWRMNSVVNNDSSGWSQVRRLRYNPKVISNLDINYEKVGTITPLNDKDYFNRGLKDSVVTISKSEKGQFSQGELNGVSYDQTEKGFRLSEYTGNIFARSHGENYWDASYFTSNNQEFYFTDSMKYRGYNFAKLNRANGKIIEVKSFKLSNAQLSSDSVVNFLNTFNHTHILVIVKGYPYGPNSLQPNARAKIREFGSQYVDTIVNRLDKWAFVSVPMNDGKFNTKEGYFRWDNLNWIPVEISMDIPQSNTEGSITNVFGPAEKWGHLSWDQTIVNNEKIVFDVYGIDTEGSKLLITEGATTNQGVDLSRIRPYEFPKIELVCRIISDPDLENSSPVFKGMRLVYQPVAEFCINTFNWISGDSAFQHLNYSTEVTLEIINAGYSNYYGAVYNWSTEIRGEHVLLNSDTVNHVLYRDSIYAVNTKFSVYDYEQGQLIPDRLPLTLNVVPLSQQNEFYTYNNKLFKTVYLVSDHTERQFSVTVDGSELSGGERVNANPEVKALLKNVSGSAVSDTSLMSVYVNGRYIPYYGITSYNEKINTFERSEQEKTFTLRLQPFLDPGENKLSFVFRLGAGVDPDTVSYNVFVDNEFRVENLYNYPNPMRGETKFMFDVNGISQSSKAFIRIYTVSGRRVKTIEMQSLINGTNYADWDGRDDDGDYMANGTYIYRLSIESENKIELPVQKLVILK